MFGYLNTHSSYSLLRGVVSVGDLVEESVKQGCDALAIVDTNSMYGTIALYQKAEEAGLKPVPGVTLSVSHANQVSKLVLLATSFDGYKNLMLLTTLAHADPSAPPSVTLEQVAQHIDGVAAVLPPHSSALVLYGNREKVLGEFRDALGAGNLYCGITPQDVTPRGESPVDSYTEKTCELATSLGLRVLPFPLAYLLGEEQREARETLFSIQAQHPAERNG